MNKLIAIDPGSSKSGLVCVIDGSVKWSDVVENGEVLKSIPDPSYTVIIEDFRPYSVKITTQAIDTCKFIGELKYRLESEIKVKVVLVSRFAVKKWVFDKFASVSWPLIIEKMKKRASKGKPSFLWVDDAIVRECMKDLYKLEKPKAGASYRYGLKSHSFQALAVASFYSSTLGN